MLLVARAQSLSGRPGDALVMLERSVLGRLPPRSPTDPDSRACERCRAGRRGPPVARRSVRACDRARTRQRRIPHPRAKASQRTAGEGARSTLGEGARTRGDEPRPQRRRRHHREAPRTLSRMPPAPSAHRCRSRRCSPRPRSPTTRVSKRFIIADRQARRIAVIDENTGQVATLVGAQASSGRSAGSRSIRGRGISGWCPPIDDGASLQPYPADFRVAC